MSFAAKMRQVWIDAMLDQGGLLRRADICEAFGISVPQASIDLNSYRAAHPEMITYDPTAKGYRRAGQESAYPQSTHDAVRQAQAAVQASP